MNTIANRQIICEVLCHHAAKDPDIVVLCSDSRGSASLSHFASQYPGQFLETGIAEQDLVGIAAGLASCGKKAYAVSPAAFLSTRSYEQIKVDVAYSDTNVKLIGISGGISYGALGMSHHSLQDVAALSAIPNMRVYLPSDRHQTKLLMESLLSDKKGAYIRVGRNPVADNYEADSIPFLMDQATKIGDRTDVLLIACGEMVRPALDACRLLEAEGISSTLLDMYCIKPLDVSSIQKEAKKAGLVVTIEEHAPFGGLGSMVCQTIASSCPRPVITLSLPDAPVITGCSREVFAYYGLHAAGIAQTVRKNLK